MWHDARIHARTHATPRHASSVRLVSLVSVVTTTAGSVVRAEEPAALCLCARGSGCHSIRPPLLQVDLISEAARRGLRIAEHTAGLVMGWTAGTRQVLIPSCDYSEKNPMPTLLAPSFVLGFAE
jgi:hypothetical protein